MRPVYEEPREGEGKKDKRLSRLPVFVLIFVLFIRVNHGWRGLMSRLGGPLATAAGCVGFLVRSWPFSCGCRGRAGRSFRLLYYRQGRDKATSAHTAYSIVDGILTGTHISLAKEGRMKREMDARDNCLTDLSKTLSSASSLSRSEQNAKDGPHKVHKDTV